MMLFVDGYGAAADAHAYKQDCFYIANSGADVEPCKFLISLATSSISEI
jgi:hypothetical protein